MAIDDYIDTYKSYANDYEKGRYEMGWSSQQRDYVVGRAREYRQLVEWLEELKELRKWKEQEEKACDRFYEQGRADVINEIENWLQKRILRTIPIEYDEFIKVLEKMKEKKNE